MGQGFAFTSSRREESDADFDDSIFVEDEPPRGHPRAVSHQSDSETAIPAEVPDSKAQRQQRVRSLVGAVACFFFAILVFFIFDSLERRGGQVRLPGLVVLAYKLLGKWGASGLLVFFGIIGLRHSRKRRRR